jgi:hypothetical protein
LMSFWKFLLLVVIGPMFGAFLASALTLAWGTSFQSNYGLAAWSIYAGFIGVFSLVVWKLAKPRETWDKSVSPAKQQLATELYINKLKKDESEK